MTFLRSIIKIFGSIIFIAALVSGATFLYIFSFYSEETTKQFDCAVVFGAAVWPGGNPSDALSDRTQTAIDVYNNGQVSCIVLSGADSAYGKHEVDVMLDIAYAGGVDLEDLELDYKGINTRKTVENLPKDRSYLLISNDFHLARISLLAKQAGVEEFAVQRSQYQLGRYSDESFFIVRELVAFWYYALGG